MLISSLVERVARIEKKRRLILRFLRDETWAMADILCKVAELQTRQAVHKTLVGMERANLVKKGALPISGCISLTAWGITSHGLAHAWDDSEDYEYRPYFDPARLSVSQIQHQSLLQKVRLAMEEAGWKEWYRGERLGFKTKVRPDAVALRPDGLRVAIEIEPTVKTGKRYQQIIRNHLMQIKEGGWDAVLYLSGYAGRLQRIFDSIDYVLLPGERVLLNETHRKRFRFLALDDLEVWLDKHRVR